MITPEQIDIFFFFKKAAVLVERLYGMYFKDVIDPFLPIIGGMLEFFIILFIIGIIFVMLRLRELAKKDAEMYRPVDVERGEDAAHSIQWKIILKHADAANPAEWKIAIIEADSILEDLLIEAGYAGETMADRLKSAGNSDTIQQAWEAHKVRNQIAHEGGMELPQREAKRVIALYESVFKRMGYL